MAKAEICPVCKGSGKREILHLEMETCHGCDGKGWILVGDDFEAAFQETWGPAWKAEKDALKEKYGVIGGQFMLEHLEQQKESPEGVFVYYTVTVCPSCKNEEIRRRQWVRRSESGLKT